MLKFLNEKGFKLDAESIDALIEAYVKDLNEEYTIAVPCEEA